MPGLLQPWPRLSTRTVPFQDSPSLAAPLMAAPSPLQSKILRAAESADAYRLYVAALEYDLADPIVIESGADVKSAPRWREHVEPFHHQVGNLISFCRRLPVTLLADDVGLGKTISAGLIMSELIARGRLTKTLVVAPKLLGPQWKEELETKFRIPTEVATGQELLAADPEEVGAVVTTYHSARTHLDELPQNRFEMLVLDEAHKLRNLFGTSQPPQVAVRFRKALEERRFRYVLMLTATPIQNRLWDLYSLVDLLTVARGHDNPFGSEGHFARKFIAGDREQARHLKPEAAEQFRAIVYGYMSRVRRGDAKLHFPAREVQLHRVVPTAAELELIKIVAKGVAPLGRLLQISILQALVSSPDALNTQLAHMAQKGSIPKGFFEAVATIVRDMPTPAKLLGLGRLIERLQREDPARWRLVVFTGRRETQNAIETFLARQKLKVGLINGASGPRNQATLAAFRADPPATRVIVSTEAGSEGVNLQAANVLVNFDLPWNPMIVEQRIGRVQRLGSAHASVGIFNIALKGTFEEYVIGRLMEKLQTATSAIGDIESLLEGAVGTGEAEEGFEEQIRQLVVASLKGVDVESEVEQRRDSIDAAKRTLVEEEKRIDELLGDMQSQRYVGPKAPHLPVLAHSMTHDVFVRQALASFGARLTPRPDGTLLVEDDSGREIIRFEADDESGATLYAPGTPPFARLVQRIVASGVHAVHDIDDETRAAAERLGRQWAEDFGATAVEAEIVKARRVLDGTVLLRARAVVAHDSFERLVEVVRRQTDTPKVSDDALLPLPILLESPVRDLGLDAREVVTAAARDPAIAEFSRFYLERRAQEVAAAGEDARKRKKMEDDFTPNLTFTMVGATGDLARDVRLRISFRLDGGGPYADYVVVRPSTGAIVSAPPLEPCDDLQRPVPASCLGTCVVSGRRAPRHRLSISSLSGRTALPAHMAVCEASGQMLVKDEIERSAVTGRLVSRALLHTSAVSGKRAEAEHMGRCGVSGHPALLSELRTSDVSGKLFRADQAEKSALSGRIGHRDEFVVSSISGHRLAPDEAVRSAYGKFCAPIEARACVWSGRKAHPDDLRICALTGLEVHFEYATPQAPPRLVPLVQLLDGIARGTDRPDLWDAAALRASDRLDRARCRIDAAVLAPSRTHLAMVAEVRTMFGLRSRRAGFVFAIPQGEIVGRVAIGKDTWSWTAA